MHDLRKIDGVIPRPCVGCGFCCQKARCTTSFLEESRLMTTATEKEGKCPFLYFDGGRFWCSIARKHAVTLAIGEGCCSSLNTERKKYTK